MEIKPLQMVRENFIRQLAKHHGDTQWMTIMSESLFNLNLSMYATKDLKAKFYEAFSTSELLNGMYLHPEQQKMLKFIINNPSCILSAPTSFGKTFVVFEYLARFKPNVIMQIVPTLALADEYKRKILRDYYETFKEYQLFQTYNKNFDYSNKKAIFILTHEKAVEVAKNEIDIINIDFLCVDEVYKLSGSLDDRVLILNFAYYYLAKKAKKYVLLAPFINGVKNIDKLPLSPIFYKTEFSPVVNDIKVCEIVNDNMQNRFNMINQLINNEISKDEKTIIYIPNVNQICSFVKGISPQQFEITDPNAASFIEWLKEEIHPEWYLVKAMENGYLIHNGQLSIGIRKIQSYLFDGDNYNKIICNSSMLEGINTSAKNIIISHPTRLSKGEKTSFFTSFDFYNLVGRSGRLFKNFIGNAYYIKSSTDPEFSKNEAYEEIEFEITKDELDINLIKEEEYTTEEFNNFLSMLNITKKDYLDNIGFKRFSTIIVYFNNYKKIKTKFLEILRRAHVDKASVSVAQVISNILFVQQGSQNLFMNNLLSNLIAKLINKNRLSVRFIVNKCIEEFNNKKLDIDLVINQTLKLKYGVIENEFYKTASIVKFFMIHDNIDYCLIETYTKMLLDKIDYIYYKGNPVAKELYEMGIYFKDIDLILRNLSDEDLKKDTKSLLRLLQTRKIEGLSFMTTFLINNY